MDRLQSGKAFRREHRFTATAAAVAYEIDPFPHIFAKLDQVIFIRLAQDLQPLYRINAAGMPVPDERGCRGVEGHADLHRRPAGLIQVGHLMPAVTEAYAAMAGRLYNFGGPLVIEHLEALSGSKCRFVNKHAAELGGPLGKEFTDKVLLDVEVLIKKFRKQLLVNVAPDAHQGKFKTGHRWRQDIVGRITLDYIDQYRPAGKGIEDTSSLHSV